MGLFENRTQITKGSETKTQLPVWFMRQAGRYHSHYQQIKSRSDFMSMCKDPELAAAVTMGPINDFHFDAAILFSDLLFPLEHLGMGLHYHEGPPRLQWHFDEIAKKAQFHSQTSATEFYRFQKEALHLLRTQLLPPEKTLLGFVGAPFTLYTYGVEGQHSGQLVSSKQGLHDGRFHVFMEYLLPSLLEEMSLQAQGGADALCLFDTAAGELSVQDYHEFVIPVIRGLTKAFKHKHPDKKIVYYSKFTHLHYLLELQDPHIDVLGVDWRMDLALASKVLGKDYLLQGNIDPAWLHLPWPVLERKLTSYLQSMRESQVDFSRWIFGLGHGVLVQTPEENVRKTVEFVHRHFLY